MQFKELAETLNPALMKWTDFARKFGGVVFAGPLPNEIGLSGSEKWGEFDETDRVANIDGIGARWHLIGSSGICCGPARE